MNDRLAVQDPGKPENKSDHSPFGKRADQNRANFLLRAQGQCRQHFEVGNAPDLSLKLFDFTHLLECFDVADNDCLGSQDQMSPLISSFSQLTSIGLVTYASKPEAFASERKPVS